MKSRHSFALVALVLALTMVGACGKSQKALDTEGLALGKDLSGLLGEATTALGGITDAESAQAALPQLTGIQEKIGGLVAKAASLSPESKQSMAGLVKAALPPLQTAIERLNTVPGVGETLKPVLESILSKVQGLM